MANTPLEIYEKAYRLHYHEKKLTEAVDLYEELIKVFPESNECAYAVIQLQKIKAEDIVKAHKKESPAAVPFLIVSFLTGFIALLLALGGTFFLYRQLRLEHQRTTLAVAALSKMYGGEEERALKLIDEMNLSSRQDVLAFELSSAIYHKTNRAVSEEKLPPPPTLPAAAADTAAKGSPVDKGETTAGKGSALGRGAKPASVERPAVPRQRVVKAKKDIMIVNPDSLNYF